jgi:hypothetical protein
MARLRKKKAAHNAALFSRRYFHMCGLLASVDGMEMHNAGHISYLQKAWTQ